jgi:hypothetical protein
MKMRWSRPSRPVADETTVGQPAEDRRLQVGNEDAMEPAVPAGREWNDLGTTGGGPPAPVRKSKGL